MTTLFVEPLGGLAGDMLLAALLDLGDPRFALDDLRALGDAVVPGECALSLEEVHRGGLRARLLTVRTPEAGAAPHRHLSDVLALLERAPLGERARARAAAVLRRIAAAESRVHGVDIDAVHLHEVGAVDTIVDVAGACLALERLAVVGVHATPPITGSGTVRCAHGEMPVPAPGTAELLRGIPHVLGGGAGERLTPTGAALLSELVDAFEPPGAFRTEAIGYGAGARDPVDGPPNVVRVQLGAVGTGSGGRTTVWLLEANLDDATPEEIGFLLERLRAAGALEAWAAPVQMKKDRPAAVVSALCREAVRSGLEAVAFAHSPTLGVRWTRTERTECARAELHVSVRGHSVRVKLRLRPGAEDEVSPLDLSPEYDDLAALARETGRPLRELEGEALTAARRLLGDAG